MVELFPEWCTYYARHYGGAHGLRAKGERKGGDREDGRRERARGRRRERERTRGRERGHEKGERTEREKKSMGEGGEFVGRSTKLKKIMGGGSKLFL
jgi:hypothetical protein